MNYREVGDTGIKVSETGFGTWELGGEEWGDIAADSAIELLRYAFDRGITFFDTADVYGPGRSETLLGEAFGGMDDQVVIATKCGYQLGTDGWISREREFVPLDLTRAHILEACDDSLERLQRDTIDFYQMHGPPPEEVWDEAFATLEDLQQAGKIRHFGVALGSMADGLRAIREQHVATLMTTFNCLDQTPRAELLPAALEAGVGVMARVPLASGFLTGTLTASTTFAENDKRRVIPREEYLAQLDRVERLRFLEDVPNVGSMAEGALRFVLAHEAVASVVAGMLQRSEVDANVKASGDPLPAEVVARVHALYESGFA